MTRGSRFGMISTLSLRNDRGPFRHDCLSPMTGPAPSFRKQGGFSSCHIGVKIIFPVIPKGIFQAKKPLFLPQISIPHFLPDFLKESRPSEMEKSSQKSFRTLIIPEKNHLLGFGSRKSFRTVNHRCRTIFFGFQPAFTLWLTSLTPLHPSF